MPIKEQIDAYFDAPARRKELVEAVSRLVAVKSVKGEPTPDAPFGPGAKAALEEGLSSAPSWASPSETTITMWALPT